VHIEIDFLKTYSMFSSNKDMNPNPTILVLNASVRQTDSKSALASATLVASLIEKYPYAVVQTRELGHEQLPYINNAWVTANLTDENARTEADRQILNKSDELITQLKSADIIVFGCPMYNFAIPATLKTYLDLVCRRGHTFEYTQTGPIGLLVGKTAYVCLVTGGTPHASSFDHATPYIKHICEFMGMSMGV
jgi:FMN-dependent NADH-azoreductase